MTRICLESIHSALLLLTIINNEGDSVSAYDEMNELYDSDGDIVFERSDGDGCFDTFVKELQKILPDGECFAYEEVGHEGFRYFCGMACVATNKKVKWCDTSSFIEKTSKKLTGKATTCSY